MRIIFKNRGLGGGCETCPCPLTNPSNQFASSCALDQDQQVKEKSFIGKLAGNVTVNLVKMLKCLSLAGDLPMSYRLLWPLIMMLMALISDHAAYNEKFSLLVL